MLSWFVVCRVKAKCPQQCDHSDGFGVLLSSTALLSIARQDGTRTEDGGQAEGGEASHLLSHAVIAVNRDDTEEVN